MGFPSNFTWGVATAAQQVEGAIDVDGRGASIWDHFTRWAPENFYEGDNTKVACDHYHRFEEDITLMRDLHIKAYRFSISWPRVLPKGYGSANNRGMDFYDRLVDALLAANIVPWVTLYHWDLPVDLYYRGGWLNPDIPKYFEDYTRIIVQRLSDRVENWMTLNEPQCFIGLGLQQGEHAPFLKLPLKDCLLAAHHALLSHGRAVRVIRSEAKKKPHIGWAPVGVVFVPASISPEDIDAARRAMFSVSEKHFWNNTWFSDPIIFGRYPEDGVQLFGSAVPECSPEEMKLISQPLDFYGANIYNAQIIRCGTDNRPQKVPSSAGPALTMYYWKVIPACLYWGPRFLYERYRLPIVITENGMAGCDWVSRDGSVHDPHRIDFTARHLLELRRACEDGIPVEGYFHWSLLDNFEWTQGYKLRFGLVHVDFTTLKRTPKDSAFWYRDVILSNGENL